MIKNKIKNWLGITDIEKDIGKKPEKKRDLWSWTFIAWGEPADESLRGQIRELENKNAKLREDFEEIDKKFDELEKFLQVEYYKKDEEVQVYEWANKVHTEGFRKTKPYEEIKKLNAPKPEKTDYEDDD